MKKLAFVIAGLTTLALVAPASAETTFIKKKHDGPRAEMRMHRDHGMQRGWHHGGSKTVIIKKRGHHHDHD